jgi:hypothetical protein
MIVESTGADPEDCQLPDPPPCVTPPTNVLPKFAPGTVTVTYNPDHFPPEKVQAIRNGYMVWNGLGNVNFTEPAPSRDRPASGTPNTLHFEGHTQPTTASGPPRDAKVDTNQTCSVGCITQAVVTVKFDLPVNGTIYCQNGPTMNWNPYEQLISHEIGHPLGLGDTYTATACCRGTSIMDGPSYHLRGGIRECDAQAVEQGYPMPTPTPPPGHCLNCTLDAVEQCYMQQGYTWNRRRAAAKNSSSGTPRSSWTCLATASR